LSYLFKQLLKRKVFFSGIFVIFFLIPTIFSLFFETLPQFVGFSIFLVTFLAMDLINLSYQFYFRGLAKLSEKNILEESKYSALLVFFSFILIILIGSLMNISLKVYQKPSSQIAMLVGIFFIINEFYLNYLQATNKLHKKEDILKFKLKYLSFPIGTIISLVVHIFTLLGVALKLTFPHNLLSLGIMALIFGVGVYLGVKKLKEI